MSWQKTSNHTSEACNLTTFRIARPHVCQSEQLPVFASTADDSTARSRLLRRHQLCAHAAGPRLPVHRDGPGLAQGAWLAASSTMDTELCLEALEMALASNSQIEVQPN